MSWLHAVIDVPAELHGEQGGFWSRVLGWPVGEPWSGHPELRSFEPPEGAPYVHLQRIDGHPRVHLDLESEDPDATVENALGLGAVLLGEHDRWRALESPGGLPFCVLAGPGHDPPAPVTWPDGHRARLV